MNYSGHPNDDSSKRFLARTTEVMLILGKDEMLVSSDVKKKWYTPPWSRELHEISPPYGVFGLMVILSNSQQKEL